MFFVDKAAARRLEAAEEMPQVYYVEPFKRLRPEIGAEMKPFCGGHMIFAGVGSPIGRAVGMGITDPISATDLDQIEEFYRSHNAPTQIDVCPHTDLAFLEMLKERGYRLTEFNNVLARELKPDEKFPPARSGIEIRPARADEAVKWVRIVGQGFCEGGEVSDDMEKMLQPMFEIPNAIPYLAFLDGEAAAGGGGLMIPERNMVTLGGAATLPQFRRRGLQTALLHTLLNYAVEKGYDLAVIVTQAGSVSQHNAERLGFQVAYTKATLLQRQ